MTKKTTRSTGDKGERIAARFLASKGFQIVDTNWRWSTLEIDLICQIRGVLVFVEVKYRKDNRFGDPVDFVDDQKMENLSIAAARYLEEKKHEGPIRFDIIGIRPDRGNIYKIRHLEDVFFGGWGDSD